MPVETISYRGLTIAVDLQGDEYAVKVCRPDGSEVLTCYDKSRDGAALRTKRGYAPARKTC